MSQFPIFKNNRRRLKKNSKTLRIRSYFPGVKSWQNKSIDTPESFPNQFSPGSRTVHSQFEERHVTLCGLAQHRDVFVQDNRKERSMPGIERRRMNDAQEPKTQRELEAFVEVNNRDDHLHSRTRETRRQPTSSFVLSSV